MLGFLHHCFFFFLSHSKVLVVERVQGEKEEQGEGEAKVWEICQERYGISNLVGLLYILNCLVFVVCWVLQMRKKLV